MPATLTFMPVGKKRDAVLSEGQEAAGRFEHSMNLILGVSKEELARREAAYQDARRDTPRPGPKRKR